MPGSDQNINYQIRPSKSIERKMMCELVKEIQIIQGTSELRYIGMGAKYFTDFLLFHNEFGVTDMISIEAERERAMRYEFNNYGTECIAALHHNKRKTNYHIHLIFAERKLLAEPIIKIASRNMFYDENGKHVRTKKEILGEDGKIREGCHVVKKGEIYEKKLFTVKDERFKSNSFLDEVKRSYTDLINLCLLL